MKKGEIKKVRHDFQKHERKKRNLTELHRQLKPN